MKKEHAASQRKKLAAIQPVFIEWMRNINSPREVYLVDAKRIILSLSTDIIEREKLSDWAKAKKALTSPVAIRINNDPKIESSKILSTCSGVSMSPRASVKYEIYTKLSLISKLKTDESINILEFRDGIYRNGSDQDNEKRIHGISHQAARAALREAYRLHEGHFTQHDADDGEPSQTIKSKPIIKTLEAHYGSMKWRISAWLLWDQFIIKEMSLNDRAAALSLLIKDCIVTPEALRSAAKEVGLSLGGN